MAKLPWHIAPGDALSVLKTLPDAFVDCVVTSPPYWSQRDYGCTTQIGLEPTPQLYVESLLKIFNEIYRVLKKNGTCWLNLGDTYFGKTTVDRVARLSKTKIESYSSLKNKDLCCIPWRVGLALQENGWYLRSDIIWEKPNQFPERVDDRPTKSHEYVLFLTKNSHYYYDQDAVREPNSETTVETYPQMDKAARAGISNNGTGPSTLRLQNPKGRNKRSVWSIPTRQYKGAHFAVMPEKLAEPCILAGCPVGGLVLDPFCGSGTTGVVALSYYRHFLGIEPNEEYIQLATSRIFEATHVPMASMSTVLPR